MRLRSASRPSIRIVYYDPGVLLTLRKVLGMPPPGRPSKLRRLRTWISTILWGDWEAK
jgi:hypothetical protein